MYSSIFKIEISIDPGRVDREDSKSVSQSEFGGLEIRIMVPGSSKLEVITKINLASRDLDQSTTSISQIVKKSWGQLLNNQSADCLPDNRSKNRLFGRISSFFDP